MSDGVVFRILIDAFRMFSLVKLSLPDTLLAAVDSKCVVFLVTFIFLCPKYLLTLSLHITLCADVCSFKWGFL